jgi:hypothetical protein
MDLLGNDALHSEDMMRTMWGDSMKAVNCNKARITYDDFLLLMKGQTRETEATQPTAVHRNSLDGGSLHLVSVPEDLAIELAEPTNGDRFEAMPSKQFLSPMGEVADVPLGFDFDDGPLSMDVDDDLGQASPLSSLFTPLATPMRGANDYIAPVSSQKKLASEDVNRIPDIPLPKGFMRKRSRSLDNQEDNDKEKKYAMDEQPAECAVDGRPDIPLIPDSRRAITLPESEDGAAPKTEGIINDKGKSALQVNRHLYRAHRQMRHSVLEACKLFEEQQARHARDVVMAQQEESEAAAKVHAGLVMRRVANKTIPSEAIKKVLDDFKKEQQDVMVKATRRGGRGRHARTKTKSDMSAMMGSASQDEMNRIVSQLEPPKLSETSETTSQVVPSVIELDNLELDNLEVDNPRKATVPGEFRKVSIDPFGAHGPYGRMP